MNVIKVFVVDNHPVVLGGVCEFLKTAGDISVVATCTDYQQALQVIRNLTPDIAILDISTHNKEGLDVLAAVHAERLPTRVLFFAGNIGPRDIIAAMAEGAYGLLSKEVSPYELIRCLREVAAGNKFLPYELLGRGSSGPNQPIPIEKLLTRREWKVLRLAAEGLSNKQISRKLGTTPGTATAHLHNIFQKIGVGKRSALAAIRFKVSSEPRDQ